ncbi:MAG: nucleotide exchange factor GrpE [Candidatus Taylorbacteria bacterium]|nr:nucleotide exchange factor GrpE [Candidatus Taylorbacteria bacterium]
MENEETIKQAPVDDVVIEEINEDGEGLDPSAKLKKLKEKLDKCVEEKQQYLDGWQRAKADFINTRKRDEEAKKEAMKFANENLLSEILPVLESFDMAMANKEVWEKVDKNWRMGVEYIYVQLKGILAKNDLVELDPINEKFDPMRDEAVEFEKTIDETKNNVIINVIQKGYSLAGRVIKAPKVKVGEFEKK